MTPHLRPLSIEKLSRAELLALVREIERLMVGPIDQEMLARAVHAAALDVCREKSDAWQTLSHQVETLRVAAGLTAGKLKSIPVRQWRKIREAERMRDEAWDAYERASRADRRAWERLEAIWAAARECAHV